MNIADRNSFVQESKRCFGCLRIGHLSKQCKARHTCIKCNGRHPTVLHDDRRARKSVQQNSTPPDDSEETAASLNADHGHSSTTSVVPVWVSTACNPQREELVYALLDTQSDSTFIEGRVCDELGASTDPIKLKLSTLLGKDVTVTCKRAKGLRIRGYMSAHYIDLPVTYTRDYIPLDRSHIPTGETARSWSHLAHLAPEIPPLLDCDVGLLIGYNCSTALAPRQVITGADGQPYAVKTDLGWSVVGNLGYADTEDQTGFCHRVSVKSATPHDVLRVLESDFKDTSHSDVNMSQDDVQFIQMLEAGIVMNLEGHLEMPLPFLSRPKLPNNRALAARRLRYLKKRLDTGPKYKQHYTQFVEGMIKNGHAETANGTASLGEVFYIPHHGVYHAKKPDKLRVVFDCSAKFQGKSLNDHLLTGPDLVNSLFGVLCRFRHHPIAIMCDIEQMFHQFHVAVADRDYLRFLWWENGDTSREIREYRMNVHLFGASSSPGCANFALKHLSKMYNDVYPLAAKFLQQDFYVDDGVTSVGSTEEAVNLIKETRELCSQGGLHLHKIVSNNYTVLESVPFKDRAIEVQGVDLNKDEPPMERTLGIQWCIMSDMFTFRFQEKDRPDTRRGILSTVASIYDPIGFISPFVLEGKAILQEICKLGVSWDDPVSEGLQVRWERWKSDLQNLSEIQISRCYKPADFGPVTRTELHHFSDASTRGYGMCSYLRFVSDERVHCCLVTSKARVSSTKVVTIPRLELTAAVLAVKMSCKLKEELQMTLDNEYFWCDSQIVLAYINNDAKRFHVFVANRVQFIRERTKVDQWQYVQSKDNPADHTSRGLSAADLLSSNWFSGPDFLWKLSSAISVLPKPDLIVDDPEVKTFAFTSNAVEVSDILDRLSMCSSWNLLVKVVARILRLAQGIIANQPLTVQEIDQAGKRVIAFVQRGAFSHEMQTLAKHQSIPTSSKLYTFNPFLYEGIIRVGGRLRNSALEFDIKHPVLLPRGGIAKLIVAQCHADNCHQGRSQTLNALRSKGYWIINGSRAVADHIYRCVQCRKLRRPAEAQKMADLPQDRVEPSPPFTYVGMDCFGPFAVKRGRSETKRYGLLLTCLCSRAIHIELLDDMTTDALINGLRCFIAIRGAVRHIRCDQGYNFIGAKNELASALKELQTDRIGSYLLEHQCDFLFNSPCSSHAGGVWERQIRTVRSVLNSTLALCPGRLDDSSLRTLFYEAMAIINSRPLSAVSDNKVDEPLTPNHLITMKSAIPLPPPGKFVKEDMYARKRWRRVQYLTEQFWSRWKKEYLLNLNQRQKWISPRRNVQVGDVVLLMDDDVPRMQWPKGIVVDAVLSDDGLVRRVKVRRATSKLDQDGRPETTMSVVERPVQKIVVILAAEPNES